MRRSVWCEGAIFGLRAGARRPERRRRSHQLADRGSRAAGDRRAPSRKARGQHGTCGDHYRRVPSDRRGAATERQGVHDDGDRRVQPRVPVCEGAVRPRRAGADPVSAGKPPAGHGGLARLLGRLSPDALRNPLCEPVSRADGQARGTRRVSWLGPDRRDVDSQVRQPLRDRDGDVQAARLRRMCRSHAEPVQYRAAIS